MRSFANLEFSLGAGADSRYYRENFGKIACERPFHRKKGRPRIVLDWGALDHGKRSFPSAVERSAAESWAMILITHFLRAAAAQQHLYERHSLDAMGVVPTSLETRSSKKAKLI